MTQFLDFPGLRGRMALEPRFGVEFVKMCERLGLVPDYLLSVMSIETAGTFDPAIQNPINPNPDLRATGLIQFMPQTAKGLGTSIPALRAMSAVEQLQYVERFFQANGSKIRRDVPGDYYMAVFMPAFVGAAPNKVLGRKDDPTLLAGLTMASIYAQNSGFDRQKRGFFTVEDVWQTTLNRIASVAGKPKIEVSEAGPLSSAPTSPASPSLERAWQSSGGPSDLPVLRLGAKGNAVTLAQALLGADCTGVYTEAFGAEVRRFQAQVGLKVDGVIGPVTWSDMLKGDAFNGAWR
jgi:hypothetical protein